MRFEDYGFRFSAFQGLFIDRCSASGVKTVSDLVLAAWVLLVAIQCHIYKVHEDSGKEEHGTEKGKR